ncbi:MAG: tripartite tricarboxylate transporter TctB family protein [Clostridiaceae bacterium]|jgi:putative tricarboxylic transport membrane protein|nr:tripartite tricarboxylate transporter TctB family protein [Clostridiaceae bacterium]
MENKSDKKPFKYDYLSAIFIYVFAIAFLINAFKIKDPGSRMFPIVICITSIAIATLIVFMTRFNLGKNKESLDFSGTKTALIMFAFLLIYVTAIEFIGFYIATPIYLYISMLVLGQKNKKMVAAVSLLFPLGVYLFFDLLLKMVIPMGRLFSS